MRRSLGLGAVVLAMMLVGTACAKKSNGSGSGSGGSTFKITAPVDGASVAEPFVLSIDSSAALGDPSTGKDHVHLCFDGKSCDSEYSLVYGDSFTIKNLSNGTHTIEASLRNADHSAAGPTTTITVTVTGGGSAGSSSPSSGGGYGYGGGG